MKKNLLALLAVFVTGNAMSQVGLEGIIVEKYYIADAADSTDAADNFATSPLSIGAITYRVYADLLPGYKLIQQFGNGNHPMEISTTTTFYNDPNYGFATYQGTSVNNTRKNTTLIDSYLTVGGVANGLLGVLKTDDTDGTIGNTDGLIANTDAAMGIAVTGAGGADGLMPGTPVIPNTLGLTTELDVFDQISGSSFVTTGGTIAALGGALGATENNHILLGQFTTDGIFRFRLNLQVATLIEGESQIFVADTPINNEIVDPTLTYESEPPIIDNVTNVVAVKNEFKIFPNPASEILNVMNLSGENVPVNYTVLDMTGRSVIQSQFWTGIHAFDIAQLPAGAYCIRLEKQGKISNLRFIKR